jgi:hypothetical protein
MLVNILEFFRHEFMTVNPLATASAIALGCAVGLYLDINVFRCAARWLRSRARRNGE